MQESVLILIVTIIMGSLMCGVIFILRKQLVRVRAQLGKRQVQSALMSRNVVVGEYHQLLGEFALLDEYDELITLSTTSKQPSLDIIGIKFETEKLDFIEIKKKGARITTKENRVRRIVESKNVGWIVKDVEIPVGTSVDTRQLPKLRQKLQPKEDVEAILNTMKT